MVEGKLFGHLIKSASSVSAADKLDGGLNAQGGVGWLRVRMICFALKGSHRALPSDNTCYCLLMLIMWSRKELQKEGRRILTLNLLHIFRGK